jgi:hypothetical protein
MKKLFVLMVCAASCAPVMQASVPAAYAETGQDMCAAPPAALYGATRASCKAIPELGFCCGYGKKSMLGSSEAAVCAYMLCCNDQNVGFELVMGVCMPATEEKPAPSTSNNHNESL